MKSRVAKLKASHHGQKLSVVESFNRKDVLSFCKHWFCEPKNSKSFAQAMKIYGGKQMCDLFALNFGGPSYDCTKRKNKKGV